MPSLSSSTELAITNPLILYRALLATKRIEPDPAQHRLALHLQNLYRRLKDYEPSVEYKYQLDRLASALDRSSTEAGISYRHDDTSKAAQHGGIFSSFREQKEKAEALALTKRLTSHESAVRLNSPQVSCL